ncbi:MAG: alpha/beta hydrolase [Bacteroidales bacterium]|nr:alpha/beta hydrolase [Bacteroidales bacterium]
MSKYFSAPHRILAIILLTLSISNTIVAKEKYDLDSTTRKKASGNFIKIPQGLIQYEMYGADTAETILLVSGFSAGYYIWDSTMQYLKNAGYRVIRFNHFGRGYSERICGTYDKIFYQTEMEDLLKALNIIDPIHIVASSMGGAISTEYAIAHPQQVKSLTLVDPMLTPLDSKIIYKKYLGPMTMNILFAPLIKSSQMRSFYNKEPFIGWDEQYKTTTVFKGSKYALFKTMQNYLYEDKHHIYKKIQEVGTSLFLIWGKEDKTIDYSNSDTIRSMVDCKFLGVDLAGHLPNLEKSSVVNPEIIEFIKLHSSL